MPENKQKENAPIAPSPRRITRQSVRKAQKEVGVLNVRIITTQPILRTTASFKDSYLAIILIIMLMLGVGFFAHTSRAENLREAQYNSNWLTMTLSSSRHALSLSTDIPSASNSSAHSQSKMATPRATLLKITALTEEERAEFEAAGLLNLHKLMQEPIDEKIAEEAVVNYNKDKSWTTIKGVQIKADKDALSKALDLLGEATGKAWTPEKVAQHLGETEEEVAKRKKGAQGVPTQALKNKNQLFRFIAQAVCLKRDNKHLSEQAFMDSARLLDGESVNWAKLLEKALATQMVAIKEKGQRLYTCAPIWQHLYKKAIQGKGKKRNWDQKGEASPKPGKKSKSQTEVSNRD